MIAQGPPPRASSAPVLASPAVSSPARLCLVWLAVAASQAAAQTPPRRTAAALDAVPTVAAVAGSGPATEITFAWTTAAAAAGDQPIPAAAFRPLNRFELLSRRRVAPAFVRERAPELSAERLVVVAVDARGREVAWQQVPDPRIIRAEAAGPTAALTGEVFYRPAAQLVVTLPDGLAAAVVRVFEARWNGTEYLLEPLAELPWEAR